MQIDNNGNGPDCHTRSETLWQAATAVRIPAIEGYNMIGAEYFRI
jgi:hypothetical protein